MGSCSLKHKIGAESTIKVIMVPSKVNPNLPTSEEEKKKERPSAYPRVSKSKQKGPLLEVRRGSLKGSDAATAEVKERDKTIRDLELIEKAFEKSFIFNTLTHDQKKSIIACMKYYSIQSNQIIFQQGQPGQIFFIIVLGMAEVLVNGNRVNTLSEGTGFGEIALMHDTPRTATVKTLTPAHLWGIDRTQFKSIIEQMNASNYQENKNFIESVSVFSILKPSQIEALLGSVNTLTFVPNQVIVKEGDIGDLLYIIKDGTVSCTRKNLEVLKFHKGEYFGEQALIYNSPRTATCTALTQVKCLSINRESLAIALGSQLQSIIFKNTQAIIIEKSKKLSKLSSVQSENLINSMEIKKYQANEIVIPKNTLNSEYLVMVLKGKLEYGDIVVDNLKCLGLEDIIEDSGKSYASDVLAAQETDLAIITKDMFEKSIGGKYVDVTNNNEAFKVLKNVQILRSLKNEKLQALIQVMKLEKYSTGDVIVEQNSMGNSLYILKSGKVQVTIDNHVVRAITKHGYFGERSIMFGQNRTATVTATEPVECWVLFQKDFLKIIDNRLRTQLMKKIELQDDNITLDDLCIVKLLGKGMFGNVFLGIHKTKKILYAIKTVDRKKINSYELHESLILEKKVLLQLDHIFIMKLVKTLKCPKRVYFVLEYVRGMDLFDVLRKMQIVSEADSKFFIGCLIVILQHLHDRDILYRDLKPENVVVDDEGYLKLIDFGTAKIVNGRTYTIVGTPHYMAPEVILRKGYSVAVDYWSLGILLYELLFERVPFADEEEEPMRIYEIVLTAKLRYPKLQVQLSDAKSVIDQLLNKNPSLRMASGFEKLKMHPWFSSLNWEKLLSKEILPPYIPKIKKVSLDKLLEKSSKDSIDSVISAEETANLPPPVSAAPLNWDEDF
jgi:cGMP-dependent protein kinase 1